MLIDTDDVIMQHVETMFDPTTGHTWVRGLITSKTDPNVGLRWASDLGKILPPDPSITPISFEGFE
jgi:hypothetical protein